MLYFKYLKNRIKFNNYRRKFSIAPFFTEFYVLQEETNYQFGYLTVQYKKLEKLPKKSTFCKKFMKK